MIHINSPLPTALLKKLKRYVLITARRAREQTDLGGELLGGLGLRVRGQCQHLVDAAHKDERQHHTSLVASAVDRQEGQQFQASLI
jgi:hypothetical protein